MLKRLASRSCFLLLICCSFAASAAEKRILVYGDSLSAGFGIAVSQSWPALLGQRLQANGSGFVVTNASISGETTAGGRTRFAAALAQFKPAVVILALGANDGLRGLPVAAMKDNLGFMAALARKQGARVLLVGMRLPPNYGPQYTQEFDAAFRDVAKRQKVALLPFLLEPIALDQNAYQADGLHPTAAAQPKILDHVWSALKPLLN
ncbi:arylesterase [Sulfuritalea hydrogenivorans]|jgi:acyl-CoA thioesterase-1|uniref:Acyl-CoA thioesterase I n=1 Tax=Sulfuritalea hydrogenivorans sk43H TaxID=1223802 RepID=W0SGT6_9PROT|nr:arylesterase [Sulfuritalea hydrogenivorans]BAO30246.1 acyl-CoA thioesterase I precursor [Sulfuritalea hydrogenivorans sk43H]